MGQSLGVGWCVGVRDVKELLEVFKSAEAGEISLCVWLEKATVCAGKL